MVLANAPETERDRETEREREGEIERGKNRRRKSFSATEPNLSVRPGVRGYPLAAMANGNTEGLSLDTMGD